MRNKERDLLIVRLEIIAKDYDGLDQYIKDRVKDTGKKQVKDLSACELLNVYDSVMCKIFR
jgi:DNA-binding protein Fis